MESEPDDLGIAQQESTYRQVRIKVVDLVPGQGNMVSPANLPTHLKAVIRVTLELDHGAIADILGQVQSRRQ